MVDRMSHEIRNPREDELGAYIGCIRTAFLGDREVTTEEAVWKAAHMDITRAFCPFPDGNLSGTSRTFPTELTVPGGATIPAAAVTEVSVLPTQRRKGFLNQMMKAMLDDARERGESVAILLASEWPIYGRFGYGPATERVAFDINTRTARFREPRSGSVEMVDVQTIRSIAPEVYEQFRLKNVGSLSRDPEWWDLILNVLMRPGGTVPKNRVRVVWRDDDGDARGYAVYDAVEDWSGGSPSGVLHVREMFGATPEADRELWRYLCEIDLVETLHAHGRPPDDPLPLHLVNGRQVLVSSRADHLWLCVLDVIATLEARTYGVDGRLTLQIADPATGKETRYSLEVDGGRAHVVEDTAAVGAEADLEVGLSAVGAAYLGGTSWSALSAAGWVKEVSPGSVMKADAMFAIRPLPYLTTNF
jgi:predicted acetyltransferase